MRTGRYLPFRFPRAAHGRGVCLPLGIPGLDRARNRYEANVCVPW